MNDMRWAERAARVGEMVIEYRLLIRDTDCNRYLRRGNSVQPNNLFKLSGDMWIGSMWLRMETIGDAVGAVMTGRDVKVV
jgi:hypothetical protein